MTFNLIGQICRLKIFPFDISAFRVPSRKDNVMRYFWYFFPSFVLTLIFPSRVWGQELPVYQTDRALIPLVRPMLGEREDSWGPWRRYLALLHSAENLNQTCQNIGPLKYGNPQDLQTALRSMLATVQYLGLKATIQANRAYAQKLGWSSEQKENMAHNLLSTCSSNMTLMGQKTMRDLLLAPATENEQVATFKISRQFPLLLREQGDNLDFIRQEALLNARLFRNLCSWGGDLDDLRLIPTLAHNPVVMSFVISQLLALEYGEDPKTHELITRINPEAGQVYCPDRLCRRILFSEMMKVFPKSLGQISLQRDLEGLYCHYLQDATIPTGSALNPILGQWQKSSTLEEERLLSSLFVSHLTGVPDLVVRAQDVDALETWISKSTLESFDRWALSAISGFSLFPEYEESMTLDVVARDVSRTFPQPIALDLVLNWGEFDRVLASTGKIVLSTQMTLPVRLAQWISLRHQEGPAMREKYSDEIKQRLSDHIRPQIKLWEKRWVTPLWEGDLLGKVVEVLELELVRIDWQSWRFQDSQSLKIPVSIRFGPQSLRYLRQQYLKKQGDEELRD